MYKYFIKIFINSLKYYNYYIQGEEVLLFLFNQLLWVNLILIQWNFVEKKDENIKKQL